MKKLLSALILGAAVLAAGCDKLSTKAPAFNNTDITGLDYAKGFSLTDHTGKPRTLQDFRGKVVLLFFGYTQCPDVCPTTMAKMATVMKDLGPSSKDVQVLFVTLDPERDTQELLAAYVPAFHPSFIGLYGNQEATARTAKEFKVFYSKRPSGDDPKNYTVDHMTGSYVFDREGRVRLLVRHESEPGAIAADLRQLL
ncbi:SCO family protein [Massilia sp. IC2-477]|uniref:SCO family protein n=1 Tax=unclassified Massilia TaxID=2609279 RepID=UPI001D10EE91|nr:MULTISPECIES: SCO family protein [unclassified Massilia]MCC2954052.1 SCO family protein [Massilia sp. IC2-477]MCC2971482.1 SCO family protein [Massilia sp. IC2-476]